MRTLIIIAHEFKAYYDRVEETNVYRCNECGKESYNKAVIIKCYHSHKEEEELDPLRLICPSCRHTVEPRERQRWRWRGADEICLPLFTPHKFNGVYKWLECPDCYEDITDAEEA